MSFLILYCDKYSCTASRFMQHSGVLIVARVGRSSMKEKWIETGQAHCRSGVFLHIAGRCHRFHCRTIRPVHFADIIPGSHASNERGQAYRDRCFPRP